MLASVIIAALAAIAAVIGSFITWKVAKRNTSGAIDTSVAADLWAEGGQIRAELRKDLVETKAALTAAVEAMVELKHEVYLARQETANAREDSHNARLESQALKAQVSQLLEQVSTIGAFADNRESRRIMDIPRPERTIREKEHLDKASSRLPEDMAADQSKDKE